MEKELTLSREISFFRFNIFQITKKMIVKAILIRVLSRILSQMIHWFSLSLSLSDFELEQKN